MTYSFGTGIIMARTMKRPLLWVSGFSCRESKQCVLCCGCKGYYGDADKLEDAVNSDEGFQHLGRTKVDVLNACVNASLTMGESEAELNVCQAIQTLNERAAEKAANQERITTLVNAIKNLMKNMGLTAEQAMSVLDVSESDREAIAPRF